LGNLEKKNFAGFLNEFYDVFSHVIAGNYKFGEHVINVKDFSPIKQVPRRIPLQIRKEVDKIIVEMERQRRNPPVHGSRQRY